MRKVLERLLSAPDLAGLEGSYLEDLLLPVAESLRRKLEGASDCLVVALSGWPGSGKSTLARLLTEGFVRSNVAALQFSLDDLYFDQATRRELADQTHPLFRFRGVPGTHDVLAGIELIERLKTADAGTTTRIPRFDKLADEPVPADACPYFRGRPDLLLIDGWFWNTLAVGEAELQSPLNEVESRFDPECTFRRAVNSALDGEYQRLFDQAHWWIELRLSDWQSSVRFRIQQEELALARLDPPQAFDSSRRARLLEFVQLMERIATRYPSSRNPDCIVKLNQAHGVDAIVLSP